jgi:hypothetical protein
VSVRVRTSAAMETILRKCGYGDEHLAKQFRFDDVTVPIVAFAGKPWDSWSACIAVVDGNGDSKAAAAKVQPLGAPTAFVCHQLGVDWWAQGPNGPKEKRSIAWDQLERTIEKNKSELRPDRIYAAKLRKPGIDTKQLWFFDIGLMPAVEQRRGETLCRLVEQVIEDLRKSLGSQLNSRQAQENLYRTVFWLLAAKVLSDKGVPNFVRINLNDVDEVFDRIGKYHGETDRYPPFGKAGRRAIDVAANRIACCGSLADVSSESLAFVNENALIAKAAGSKSGKKSGISSGYDIRKELGIHSTPPAVINHMLARLWPLIEEIDESDRHVFEPACGHAPFLTAALRWLRDWGSEKNPEKRHNYLKGHLHGIEADSFAIEVAKLSLLLADAPHGNKWDIKLTDMFATGILRGEARKAMILLANPPYESFTQEAKSKYSRMGAPVTSITKAVEMLNRTLPNLPKGGVFGVVVPQGTLHDKESLSIRKFLLEECELCEIDVFADNLFEHGDHEVAVIMGRRRKGERKDASLDYRRVRERGMNAFKERLEFTTEQRISETRFTATDDQSLFRPDLAEVWDYLSSHPKFESAVHIQKGREYWEQEELEKSGLMSSKKKTGWVQAVLTADDNYDVWSGPGRVWIDPSEKTFRPRGGGAKPGIPQVILNYSPAAREPWRLKPFLDEVGIGVSSRFLVFRPKPKGPSLKVIWALLMSPVANAYAYCWSGKRETLVKEWRNFPLPEITGKVEQVIGAAVDRYLEAIRKEEDAFMTPASERAVRQALIAVDAEVLRLYDLPPKLERQLLNVFTWDAREPKRNRRKGVGCTFGSYFPADFRPCIPLHEYISEAYRDSTAGSLVHRFEPVRSKAALAAIDVAEKLAAGE